MQTKSILERPFTILIVCLLTIATGCGQSTPPQSAAPAPTQSASSPSPVQTPTQTTQAQAPQDSQVAQPLSPPSDRKKITFEPGSSSTTIEGNLASKATEQYTFEATANQTGTITITSPNQTVLLTLVAPSGSPIQRYQSGQSNWTGTLPESGAYRVSVVATDQASSYKLNVSILQKKPGG